MAQTPAIFELEDDTGEANGIVHPFCSIACRMEFDGPTGDCDECDTLDFGFDPMCETCGKIIRVFE